MFASTYDQRAAWARTKDAQAWAADAFGRAELARERSVEARGRLMGRATAQTEKSRRVSTQESIEQDGNNR